MCSRIKDRFLFVLIVKHVIYTIYSKHATSIVAGVLTILGVKCYPAEATADIDDNFRIYFIYFFE